MLNTLLAYIIKKTYYYYYNKYKHKYPKIDKRGKRAVAFFYGEDLPAEFVRERPWMSSNRFGNHITWEFYQVARYNFYVVGGSMYFVRNWKTIIPHLIYDIIGEIIYIIEIIMSYRLYWYNVLMVFVGYVGYLIYSFVEEHAAVKYQEYATAFQYIAYAYYLRSPRFTLTRAKRFYGFGSFWHILNYFRRK